MDKKHAKMYHNIYFNIFEHKIFYVYVISYFIFLLLIEGGTWYYNLVFYFIFSCILFQEVTMVFFWELYL